VEMGSGVGVGKAVWGCCFCGPYVFGYISVVVEEGVSVRDCRGLGGVKLV
jgi:hypothetical protein